MNSKHFCVFLMVATFLFYVPITAQEQSILITNTVNGKEKIIKENKRGASSKTLLK